MKLFSFDANVGFEIQTGDSTGARMSRVGRWPGGAQAGVFHLHAGGRVWRHPATVPQLLLVVAGEAWVSGQDGMRVRLVAGQAAFWQAGEEHETSSDTGATAVVLEGAELDPARFMPELAVVPA